MDVGINFQSARTTAMANLDTQSIQYQGGGATLKGFLATDKGRSGKRPGVLVVHEWWGLNDYIRRRARMLAEMGYVALAADIYGDGKTATSPAEATTLMNGILGNIKLAELRLTAARERLAAHPDVDATRIAAIGYCFGGAVVLHAARVGMPLRGVVSFHGALGSFHKPAPGSVTAKVLVCHGAADSLVPDSDIANFKQEMDAAKADYQFIAYPGALHGFTNPEADDKGKKYGIPLAYDAAVDKQSWQDMQDFFARIFA
jgi:dienelactone hydrolase